MTSEKQKEVVQNLAQTVKFVKEDNRLLRYNNLISCNYTIVMKIKHYRYNMRDGNIDGFASL